MAAIRRLPSGKFQATVRLPNGKRTTRTDRLRRVVADWARSEEERVARGEWRDQRSGRVNYDDWRDRFLAARVVEEETARTDRSMLRNHIDPQWSGWRLPSITRLEVGGWIKRMQSEGVGPHAIRDSYQLLSTMMSAAVDEGIIAENPCRRIDLPATPAKLPEWFTRAQVDAIAAELPERHAAAVHLMSWCGLRWGECAGLRVGNLDWLRRRLRVQGVTTQQGRWKEYPKTSKSRREIPVPGHVLEILTPLAVDKSPGELLFHTERPYKGELRPWSGANWRLRWYGAIEAAREKGVPVPLYSPHALRHTAASLLVQEGVPLYDVQRLLGHESFAITARYAHLSPDTFSAIESVWQRMRDTNVLTHESRIEPPDEDSSTA